MRLEPKPRPLLNRRRRRWCAQITRSCRAQDLLRQTIPSGDLGAVLDRALTLLVDDLERRRCAAVPTPRSAPSQSDGRHRYVPSAVRRAVWKRDEGRCAFVGTAGRCRENSWFEFHHVQPFAEGGPATLENIQLRCRAHNQYEARLWFKSGSEEVRERGVDYAPPRSRTWTGLPDIGCKLAPIPNHR